MAWIGNTVSAHIKKGHHPRPRWKVDPRTGQKKVSRWVCDCGATLRR